jgi:hypothetical protein
VGYADPARPRLFHRNLLAFPTNDRPLPYNLSRVIAQENTPISGHPDLSGEIKETMMMFDHVTATTTAKPWGRRDLKPWSSNGDYASAIGELSFDYQKTGAGLLSSPLSQASL